ncbi:hypothetical protein C8R43DRAFT_1019908 [Mycena crocata]|nr:hypothetical protein C8R43DRAFT_1019908 [Mycena crocata]
MGWGADIQELISRLLHHGVEFRACVRNQIHHPPNRLVPSRVLGGVEFRACVRNQLHRPPGRLFPNRVLGLESRPVGYIPTLVDHDLYVNQRESFLRSPRGRAALLAGGIIGRLARDIADERSVFNGPSDGVLTTGVCLWNETNAIAYWDDTLTEDEIDLICGVDRIATGHDAEQVSTPSWWPKPAAFAKSGLGIGWWSPDCEFWFQKRLRDIQAGKAELHTQTMWRRYLRLVKTAHEVAEANNTISAEFLNNVLAQI